MKAGPPHLRPNGWVFPAISIQAYLVCRYSSRAKYLIREMLRIGETTGSGWADYMWPKPGESVSTRKSAYVSKARLGDSWVLVGCGVYLADAPRAISTTRFHSSEEAPL